MTWFKVDDGFWSHPKVLNLSDSAVALWTRAGAYCCQHLTDGVVSSKILRVLGDEKAATELVESGLWRELKAGYKFHDWGDYQETSDTVKERRKQARERMQKLRAGRKSSPERSQDVRANKQRTNSERSQDVREKFATPDPTRPDPSRPNTGVKVASHSYGGNARDEMAGGDFPPDELADATRRAREAGISDEAIREGTRRYEAKPEPKTAGLLVTLIREAAGDIAAQTERDRQRQRQLRAVAACDMCDERGFQSIPVIDATGCQVATRAKRCDHHTPPTPEHEPTFHRRTTTQTRHRPKTSPKQALEATQSEENLKDD